VDEGSEIFNIGSDDVKPFKDVYRYVITKASQNSDNDEKGNPL